MTKSLFAALGLAGACAACCSIPLLLPLLGGTAASALLTAWRVDMGIALNVLIVPVWVVSVGAVLWMKRRRKVACHNTGASTQAVCTRPPDGCGCRPEAVS